MATPPGRNAVSPPSPLPSRQQLLAKYPRQDPSAEGSPAMQKAACLRSEGKSWQKVRVLMDKDHVVVALHGEVVGSVGGAGWEVVSAYSAGPE